MSGPRSRFIHVVLATSTILGLAVVHARAEKPFRLDEVVPDSAFALISVPDVSAVEKAFPRTALAKIFREEEVQEFLVPLIEFLEGKLGEFREREGIDLLEAARSLRGEVGIAVIDVELGGTPMPNVLIAIDGRERVGKLRDLIDSLVAKGKPSTFEHTGTIPLSIHRVEPPVTSARLEIRYDWAEGETDVKFRLLREGSEVAAGAITRPAGGAAGWCAASASVGVELPVGDYVLELETPRAAKSERAPDGLVAVYAPAKGAPGGETIVHRARMGGLHIWDRKCGDVPVRVLEDNRTRMDAAFAGSVFLIASRPGTLDDAIGARAAKMASLAELPLYETTMARVSQAGTPVVRAFVNLQRIFERFGPALQPQAKLLEETGLAGIQALGFASTLDGSGYTDRLHIRAPGEKRGLFRLTTGKPVDRDLLRVVPPDAFLVSAGTMDLAAAWVEVMRVIAEVRPDAFVDVTRQLEQVEGFLGFKLKEDLIDSIGGDALLYVAPPRGGGGLIPDVVLSLAITNEEAFQGCLDQALAILAEQADGQVTIESTEYRGQKIGYAQIAGGIPVTPSWTIVGGRLIVALSPQTLKGILRTQGKETPDASILDSEDYQRAVKRLPPTCCAVSYTNLSAVFDYAYNTALPFLQAAEGEFEELPIDLALLPSSEAISQHLEGAVSGLWIDDSGLTWSAHAPVSLLSLMAPASLGFLMVAESAPVPEPRMVEPGGRRAPGVPMPEPGAVPGLRDADVAHLDEIGAALLVHYVMQDAYPQTFEALVKLDYLANPSVLVSPGDDSPRQVGSVKCSYEYIGAEIGKIRHAKARGRAVLAWSRKPIRAVLFLDGACRRVPEAEFQAMLAETRKRIAAASK